MKPTSDLNPDSGGPGDGRMPGRPRSPAADAAILQAAIEVLSERGFADSSVEAVAELSGVAKTTIYRRFPGKVDLFTAAVAAYLKVEEFPDTGSLRGDLLSFATDEMVRLFSGRGASMVGTFLAEKDRNPQLIEAFRARLIQPRRRQFHAVFERAAQRGEIRPGADFHLAAQALMGVMLARVLSGASIDRQVVESAVDIILDGISNRER